MFHKAQTPYKWVSYNSRNMQVNSEIKPDPTISAILAPYKKHVHKVMDKVVGYSTGTFKKGLPDGTLENLVADAIRTAAGNITGKNIDIGVISNSGIQAGLGKGKITLGMIYNVMPYNNHLVILSLTGKQVQALADEIAASNGEPVSGLRMSIINGKGEAVLIGSQTLHPDSVYTVATNDYLANGGGNLSALWKPKKRIDENLSIRKAITTYIENRGVISPLEDGRIR